MKPASQELLHLPVIRTERLSPHWMRVTLGGGEIDRFTPLGHDQWFRLFLPVGGDEGLERIPAKANKMFGYLRFLRIPDGVRPVMRNYTVRAYRAATADAGAEIDVDFVLHGSAADGTAGPASAWAETCEPGESVVIIDEGLGFNPARGVDRVVLVADETGLPAVAGICASLPADATGVAIIEAPTAEDVLEFPHPVGIDVRWIVRGGSAEGPAGDSGDSGAHSGSPKPGEAALTALREVTLPDAPLHAFIVGEQALPTSARRHLVGERGVDKDAVSFIGYWRHGAVAGSVRAGRDTEPASTGEGRA